MVFYPDNEKRATRLQQLVDSMANLQTDVKNIGHRMDEKNAKYRPAINALLKAHGMATVDDVIKAAAAKMTPGDKKVFEALIKTVKDTKSGFDTTYFIAGLLLAPEGVLTGSAYGKAVLNIARFGVRMVNIKWMANFFKAAEEGSRAATTAATEITAEAEAAERTIKEAGEAGEEFGEAAKAATLAGRISTFFKILGAIGLVVTVIAGVIEAVVGAEQRRKLIEAIHGLQPARLSAAFFKREGTHVLSHLETLDLYLAAMPGGAEPNPALAARVAKKLIGGIAEQNAAIDLDALETDLEVQDRTSALFYGGDDLGHEAVVAAASKQS